MNVVNPIRVRCDTCGKDNYLPADRVWLHPPVTDDGVALYTFDCEHCQHHNQRPADRHVVRMLTAVGVSIDGDPVDRLAVDLADDNLIAAEVERLAQR